MGEPLNPQPENPEKKKTEAMELFRQAYEHQVQGDFDRAITLYQKSIETFPTAEAYTFLGWTYSFQGKYDEAIAECRRAIETDPDFGNPYNDIGAYLIEKGRPDEAIPWFEKAIHAKRYDSYCFPHYNLGRVWETKGEWEKALACYREALKTNPDYDLASRALNRLQGMFN
jgi:tetratricopeptide (TPR) repeat protein